MSAPKMYAELADWWPLVSAPSEYEEEAAGYERLLLEASRRPVRTLLELGSGGGNNASWLKARFDMTLVDLSPGMVAVSRALNPECDHILGDMRTVRLGRRFDAVFVHDAISHMTTGDEVRQVIETAVVHCAPGGAVLFAPDHLKETFTPSTDHGGHDGPDRALRFLAWGWDPDPADTTCLTDYVFALRGPDGSVRIEQDRHVEGLFGRGDWVRWLSEAGLHVRVVTFEHSELEPGSYELFVCTLGLE